jgi:hypothetical protein
VKRVRLTQIDGKLPNLALMKLSHWHRQQGDEVYFTKHVERSLMEPTAFDLVYGSAIFSQSAERVAAFLAEFPNAIVGGTWNVGDARTVEQIVGSEYEHYDYSIYPGFADSIGFTQRGCRLKCGFCVVPKKEGKPRSINTISDLWRGPPYPRHLHLLDNDFFGQAEDAWRARLAEISAGGFKVSFTQGINIRLITEAAAEAISSVPYFDDSFRRRRLYTAWDNLKDEGVFLAGVERLRRAGVPPSHLLVYMLIGFDKRETWARLFYRFNRMVELGIRPYPMVFGDRQRRLELGGHNEAIEHRTLGEFQRWVLKRYYRVVPFRDYDVNARGYRPDGQLELLP